MANGLTFKTNCENVEDMKFLASTLAPLAKPDDVIVLNGDLGAGKTQFVQGFARALGVVEPVVSPTFNILLSYYSGRLPLFHFDLYRLDDVRELDDLEYFETLEAGGVSFIEWGDKFPEALPFGYLEIDVRVGRGGVRTVEAHSFGERSRQLLFLWSHDKNARLQKVVN